MVFVPQLRSVEGIKRLTAGFVLVSLMTVVGCSGSEEMMQQQAQKIAEYEKQMEEMRTENTTLRQRMFKLEQDNKNLEARLSDSEAKLIDERDRADKASEALKAALTKPAQPMKETRSEAAKETRKEPAKEAPSSAGAMAGYDEALSAVKARKYDDAIAKFEALLSGGIGDDWADNCHYWIGESQYAKKQYQEAIKHFEMVMNYQKSEKFGDAHYMTAQCYERMGDKAKAKEHYERVVKDYPTSTKVKIAKERWEKM